MRRRSARHPHGVPNDLVHRTHRSRIVILATVWALTFAASAYAAYNYVYWNSSSTPDNSGGGDLDVLYRNYNDSCSGDGYAWTKSIYGLADGSWVAALDGFSACGINKTHLGPSSNYGYTYVQSKCRNIHGTSIWLICNTSRP